MRYAILAMLFATLCFSSALARDETGFVSANSPANRQADIDSGGRAIPQEAGAVSLSPRPTERPVNLVRRNNVLAAGFRRPSPPSSSGELCGVAGLEGELAPTIPGRLPGCGLAGGIWVRSVDGVTLSQPAAMDCGTARALDSWVRGGLKPAVGRRGGGVAEIKVAAHYICRTRNNQPGAKISEHGRGRAIDISAITLNNGARMSVLTGWRDPAQGPVLKAMHRAACGVFGTVLGPNADRWHRDHFHFDTARYRSGVICR